MITGYSVIMGLIWFTAAMALGSFLLGHGRGKNRDIVFVIFVLGFLRMILPFDSYRSYIVESWNVYPFLCDVAETEVLFGCSALELLLALWAAGSVTAFIRLAAHLGRLSQVRRRAVDVEEDSEAYLFCRDAMRQMGYRGKFRLAVTSEFSTAVSAGYFRPCILLPGQVADFSLDELKGILQHETVHYLMKDQWIKFSLLILKCLLWWNPAVYFLAKSGEQMMELRCDRTVCCKLSEREKIYYLEAIVHTLKTFDDAPQMIPLGNTGYVAKRQLKQRFHAVLQPERNSKISLAGMFVVSFLVFALSYTFVIQPAGSPDPDYVEKYGIYTKEEDELKTFILSMPDGTYILFEDGRGKAYLSEKELREQPYNLLMIVKGE